MIAGVLLRVVWFVVGGYVGCLLALLCCLRVFCVFVCY